MVKASFWIRFYDLPLMACNEYIGRLIGNLLGRFEEVDLIHGRVEWREYMRIRVDLDITRPLLRQRKLNIGLAQCGFTSSTKGYWISAFTATNFDTNIRNVEYE